MSTALSSPVLDRVTREIGARLAAKGVDPGRLTPDASLSEAGLSSLELVNLILALEGAFDLMIPEEELTLENLRSARRIEALLLRLGAAG